MSENGQTDDDKIVHARNLVPVFVKILINIAISIFQLKRFQSKQQQNKGRASSTVTTSTNGFESSALASAPFQATCSNAADLQLENSSSYNESLCNGDTSQTSRDSTRPPSSIGPTNDLLMINSQFEQFRCHSIPKSSSDAGQIVICEFHFPTKTHF